MINYLCNEKIITLFILTGISISGIFPRKKKADTRLLQPIEIRAVEPMIKAPFTKTNLAKNDVEKVNRGQDPAIYIKSNTIGRYKF